MGPFGVVESQTAGERIEHVPGDTGGITALQAGVARDADASQHGHLVPAQARDPAAPAGHGHPGLSRGDPRSAGGQELADVVRLSTAVERKELRPRTPDLMIVSRRNGPGSRTGSCRKTSGGGRTSGRHRLTSRFRVHGPAQGLAQRAGVPVGPRRWPVADELIEAGVAVEEPLHPRHGVLGDRVIGVRDAEVAAGDGQLRLLGGGGGVVGVAVPGDGVRGAGHDQGRLVVAAPGAERRQGHGRLDVGIRAGDEAAAAAHGPSHHAPVVLLRDVGHRAAVGQPLQGGQLLSGPGVREVGRRVGVDGHHHETPRGEPRPVPLDGGLVGDEAGHHDDRRERARAGI